MLVPTLKYFNKNVCLTTVSYGTTTTVLQQSYSNNQLWKNRIYRKHVIPQAGSAWAYYSVRISLQRPP